MAKLTTDEFIKRAREVHGDKYDYTKVNYVNKITKVCIVCPSHGDFCQSPKKHLAGQGCKKCFRESVAKKYSMGRDKFIEKANTIHNGLYDYSEVYYVNCHTKVLIKCPIHGTFPQEPASHLAGHGCPKCAAVENGKRCQNWTNQKCFEVAQKYKTKAELYKGNAGAYNYALEKGLLEKFYWLEEQKKPNGYWTRERCEEESRKYHSKKEFLKGCSAAHHAAAVNGWLDDFYWLIDKRIDIINDRIDSVYVYVFEDMKTAYVGRTLMRRQKNRDMEHIFNFEVDNVARFAMEHHVPVPPMKILESKLTLREGLDREDYWRKWYEKQGYSMLNRSATGVGKGSLGGISYGKWNRKTCYGEAKKYNSSIEFERGNGSAYSAARKNGWVKDYTWFDKLWEKKWDKNTCYEEAKKYKTRGEFRKNCRGGYRKAWKMGWLDEFDWLTSRQFVPAGFWDNYNHCFEEAKKYKNRRRFLIGCPGAYNRALKNGWLDDYVWFTQKQKHNFWNRDTCYEEAKKYNSRSEFGRNAVRAYELALVNGWLDDYTWFKPLTGFWTYDSCKAEAAKYEKRSHFKEGCVGAYTKSRINGWLDEFFPPPPPKSRQI